jgi:hypothetical protein
MNQLTLFPIDEPRESVNAESIVESIVGAGFMGEVLAILDDVVYAEGQIEVYMDRYPERRDAIWSSFRLLERPPILREKLQWMYERHVLELLERVAHGSDTRPGTDAEVCAACYEMSQVTPFSALGLAAFATAFLLVFDTPGSPAGHDVIQEMRQMRDDNVRRPYRYDLEHYLAEIRRDAGRKRGVPTKEADK